MLRVHFLLREQIQAGRHDHARSLVRSVWKDATEMNQPKGANRHRTAAQHTDISINIMLMLLYNRGRTVTFKH